MIRQSWLLAFSCTSLTTSTACFVSDYTPPTATTDPSSIDGSSSSSSASGNGSTSSSSSNSSSNSTSGGTGSGSGGMGGAGGGNNGGMGGAGGSMNSGGSGGAGGMPPVEFCDSTVDSLLACFQFDGPDPELDGSGKPNTISSASISLKSGKDGLAGSFAAPSSYLRIDTADHWNVQEFTVEAWIYIRNFPVAPERLGIFDSDGRYGFFVIPTDALNCSRGPTNIKWTGLQLNTWTHVACAFDGSNLSLHVNGSKVAEMGGGTPPAAGMGANAIGGNAPSGNVMDGMIDNFRVWNVRRTDKEICEAWGGSGC